MYSVGMYGGSFAPLHIGHLHNIAKAAGLCKKLYIVISWSEERESVSKNMVYRWLYYYTKHLSNIVILTIEDKAKSKEEYTLESWQQGANDIKQVIGEKIDVVFCGSDYKGTNRFEELYESEVVYFERDIIPISSSEIRINPYKHWKYLPPICRAYYTKRVLIVGSESTGKTTLTQNLAMVYNTNYVTEVGREVCALAGGEDYMNLDDLVKNLLRQKDEELKALPFSNKILFIDTDALTTKFYGNFLLSLENEKTKCNALADAISDLYRFDLVFFLEPTVDFVQDGTRNEKIEENRLVYSNQLKELFLEKNIPLISLDGSYNDRFETAKQVIEQKLKILLN